MSPSQVILRTHALKLAALAMVLLGALNASIAPYVSLVAIHQIGLSEQAFSVVLFLTAGVAVSTAVLAGVVGDQRGNRRKIALFCAASGAVGLGMMMIAPNPLTFVVCHALLLPISSTIYGQIFALARLAAPKDRQDAILGVVRSGMSISFLAMLIFWTIAFSKGVDVMHIYIPATFCSVILLALFLAIWPAPGKTTWEDRPSGLNLRAALAELARPHVALRLGLLGMISASFMIYFVLISLIFEASSLRSSADVALYVGLVAGWEVPCLLLVPRLVGRFTRTGLITLSAGFYTLHIILMPIWVDTAFLWLGTFIAGVGGTAAISLPISYFQDLLRDRPGAASAMLALQRLVADVLGASIFAIGTWIGGYQTVAIAAAALTIIGAGLLYIADRRRWLMG
jgi:MFS transporter, SET family, sugar efflux transporter